MTARAALVGAALALVLAGCDGQRRAISRDDLPDVPEDPTFTVELGDDGFDTAEIQVSTDDLVEFVNAGENDHGVRTRDSSIDTGALLPGESTYIVFEDEARYELFDVADDSHTMTVLAAESPAPDR